MENYEQLLKDRVDTLVREGYPTAAELARRKDSITDEVELEGRAYQIDMRCWFEDGREDSPVRVQASLYEVKNTKWWHVFQIDRPVTTYTEIIPPQK